MYAYLHMKSVISMVYGHSGVQITYNMRVIYLHEVTFSSKYHEANHQLYMS